MFNRPVEYDPDLLLQVESEAPSVVDKEAAMMNEFGLDDDSEGVSEDEDDSEEDSFSNMSKKKMTPTQAEFDKLTANLTKANQLKLQAEQRFERAQEKQLQVQRQSKQAKFLLMERHSKQIEALKNQLTEHEKIVANDAKRSKQLAVFLSNVKSKEPVDITPESLFCQPLTEPKGENTKLRATLERLNSELRCVKISFSEVEKDRDKYSRQLPADFMYESGDRLQLRLAATKAAIQTAKADLSVKDKESTETRAKIMEIKQNRENREKNKNDPGAKKLSPVEQEKQRLTELLKQVKKDLADTDANEKATQVQQDKVKKQIQQVENKKQGKLKELKSAKEAAAKDKKKKAEQLKASTESKDQTVAKLKAEKTKLDEQTQAIEKAMKGNEGQLSDLKDKAKEKLNEASESIKALKAEYSTLKGQHTAVANEAKALLNTNKTFKTNVQKIENAGARRKTEAQKMVKLCAANRKELSVMKKELEDLTKLIPSFEPKLMKEVQKFENKTGGDNQTLQENYKKELQLRRKYFAQYQQLRGSVRVYACVRDVPGGDDANNLVRCPNDDTIIVKQPSGNPAVFEFDNKVMNMKMNSGKCYDELADLIASLVDGFSVSIFCYGPTNTGKSHTLRGEQDKGNGLYHHCIKGLFQQARESKGSKFNYTVHVLEFSRNGVKEVVNNVEVKTEQDADGLHLSLENGDVVEEKAALSVMEAGVFAKDTAGAVRVLRIEIRSHNETLDRTSHSVLHIVEVPSDTASEIADNVQEVIQAKASLKDATSLSKGSFLMHSILPYMGKNDKIVLIAHVDPTNVALSMDTLAFAVGCVGQPQEIAKKKKK